MSHPKNFSALDSPLILKDARNALPQPSRRLFAKRVLTLGGLSLLTGCDITDDASVNQVLQRMSRMNDTVQGWLFDPNKLAPTYPASMITRPFPFNAFYGIEDVVAVDESSYQLEIRGRVSDKHCRKSNKSHAIFAWKAGVPLAVGVACRSLNFCATSAPTCKPNTWRFVAATITTPASTWPPPCIRKLS